MIKVYIGGVDYSEYTRIEQDQMSIESNITTKNDQLTFNVCIPQQIVPRPKGKQEVYITNGTNPDNTPYREFGGVINQANETALAADVMYYECTAKDYTAWFDKHRVTYTYKNMAIEDIVKDIVNRFTVCGFTTNHVYATGITLASKPYNYIAPSQAIQSLADQCNFWFYIDYYKDVHFEPILSQPSMLPNNLMLPDEAQLDPVTGFSFYQDLEFDEDTSQVDNQCYLYGYKIPTSYQITQSWKGDGQATTFTATYELIHALGNLLITVDGIKRTNALDISEGSPNDTTEDGKVYINYKQGTLRFNVAPISGAVVALTYQPMFDQVSMFNNPESFSEMKSRDGFDGIYEGAISNSNLSSTDNSLANLQGAAEMKEYSLPYLPGKFYSYLQGWLPGMYFYCTSNRRMDGELQNSCFYVLKVTKSIVQNNRDSTPIFYYEIDFANVPYNF